MRRLSRVVLGAMMLLLAPALLGEEKSLVLGGPLVVDQETPIDELIRDPEMYHGTTVRIAGRIASVCTQEGCFIEVVPRDGGGEGIVVNFPGLAHTFPVDCAGLEAEHGWKPLARGVPRRQPRGAPCGPATAASGRVGDDLHCSRCRVRNPQRERPRRIVHARIRGGDQGGEIRSAHPLRVTGPSRVL